MGVAEINIKSLSPTHKVRLNTKGPSDVHVTINTVAPGGNSGWHTHPGPSFVVVKSGTATLYDGDDPTCTPRVIETKAAGSPTRAAVTCTWSATRRTVNLVLAAFQIVPAGEMRRQDIPVGDPRIPPCGFSRSGHPALAQCAR